MQKTLLVSLVATALSFPALAQVQVEEAWVRGTVPQQRTTGAFMRLTAERDVRLVGAESPAAGVVEIHEMAMENDVMKMRRIPLLELPAGQPTELKPGGYHVMLMELHHQMKGGDSVPITMIFEDAATGERFSQAVDASVVALGAATPKSDTMPMDGHGVHKH